MPININWVTVALAVIFLLPIISGFFLPFSRERIQRSLYSLLDNIEFIFSLLLSVYLTKRIFFENGEGVFRQIYGWIPENIKSALYGKDILTYIVAVPVILLIVQLVLRLFTTPLYRLIVDPLSDVVYSMVSNSGSVFRRLVSILWNVPKSVFMVIIFGLLINFYAYYFSTPALTRMLNESPAYQFLYHTAVQPALNSNLAKQVPVLVNDSFRKSLKDLTPIKVEDGSTLPEQLAKQLSKGNIKVIEYFNGVTLDEAVKSSPEIDATAKKIVGSEKDDRKKGYLIYKWICANVKYDYDKAQRISTDPRGISSGADVAFTTRKGICFDYSSLYVAMCRAVGLKVRLVTGLGYSGISWGDHAWNQVYDSNEKRWINVDTTFGSVSNYYDKTDFDVDHKYAEVQREW